MEWGRTSRIHFLNSPSRNPNPHLTQPSLTQLSPLPHPTLTLNTPNAPRTCMLATSNHIALFVPRSHPHLSAMASVPMSHLPYLPYAIPTLTTMAQPKSLPSSLPNASPYPYPTPTPTPTLTERQPLPLPFPNANPYPTLTLTACPHPTPLPDFLVSVTGPRSPRQSLLLLWRPPRHCC